MLEDKFFNIIEATSVKGKLKDEKGTQNQWMTEEEFYSCSPKYHNDEEIFEWYKYGEKGFK